MGGGPNPSNDGPAGAPAGCDAGTRRVVMHVGHRTSCPNWDSSADNDVRQTWQTNTIISPEAT